VPVLIEPMDWREPRAGVHLKSVDDSTQVATLSVTNSSGEVLTLEMRRPNRLIIGKRSSENWEWWSQGNPVCKGQTLTWKGKAKLQVMSGKISKFDPAGYQPVLAVGFGKLKMRDPVTKAFPRCTIEPNGSGEIVVEIRRD